MIRYSLSCERGHDFDGWFRSSAAFDSLQAAGAVTCTVCGSAKVRKALMAPAVAAETADRPAPPAAPPDLRQPQSAAEAALARLRREIEASSDYVGLRFAEEARAIHDGAQPQRAIHGEARLEDARRLVEDGIPIAPLPFLPRQKAN